MCETLEKLLVKLMRFSVKFQENLGNILKNIWGKLRMFWIRLSKR